MIFIPFHIRATIKRLKRKLIFFFFCVFMIWYVDCLPEQLFNDSTSTVLLDRNGELLGAHISADEQWRFPLCDSVPKKFETCITEFEDRNFRSHFGVSIKGVFRAVAQNLRNGRRVSGGSTLTMQVIRLMRKNPKRSYCEKILEILLATRLEIRLTKDEILQLYCSHAPFGNNVVGLDAAAWRFFHRPAHQLSWAESATLAVLPNAPGLIYPGRNQNQLRAKRNRLLKRLHEVGEIDDISYEMALTEPLPSKPHPLPTSAPHVLNKCLTNGEKGKTVKTTINARMQREVNQLLESHISGMRENKIYNGAVLITDVNTGEIVAYAGNAINSGGEHSNQVDCAQAPRSTGSILKPLLYAKSLEAGIITPKMQLVDVPSKFGGFSPKNFSGSYDGLVPADKALSRSLNIPMVHLLNRYGLSKFHSDLNDLGFSTIRNHSGHYGLSLILGGAEVTLWDLNQVYTNMAQTLKNKDLSSINYLNKTTQNTVKQKFTTIEKASIYCSFEAMTEVKRPDADNQWKMFSSSQKIAWKTGTSFGFRDAWSIGITPDYVISVWIGNADGEGRPGLTGLTAAAPLLFELFHHLPRSEKWFPRPTLEMSKVPICVKSGHRATRHCEETSMDFVPKSCLETKGCLYHHKIHLNQTETRRVSAECYQPSEMIHKSWFILPSSIEQFYQKNHSDFRPLPDYDESCSSTQDHGAFSVVYPRRKQRIYLPKDFNHTRRKIILEAVHRNRSSLLFWHLDGCYIGQTREIHQIPLIPSKGKHHLSIVDEFGNQKNVDFEVLN